MQPQAQKQLIDDHFLFKEGDRFLQAAHACEHWPVGRGIFHNADKTFLVWINEEDHLRLISMQKGGNLKQVVERLIKAIDSVEHDVHFTRDKRLGFLTFCPTNLGTTIRASVHIKLPHLGADRTKLEEIAAKYNLQVRGTSGEHTDSQDGVYDISNKRRLGLTQQEAITEMQNGILELIKKEKESENGHECTKEEVAAQKKEEENDEKEGNKESSEQQHEEVKDNNELSEVAQETHVKEEAVEGTTENCEKQ